jgi:carbonic anhydrase
MRYLRHLFEHNWRWAEQVRSQDPEFFANLSRQQSPEYLWIGCSDSRVPANQIVGLKPGEVFVHRNVANVVVHTDLNCLSVIQYAVDVLRVRHVIVCGHYGCGGVQSALRNDRLGLIDNWLRHVQDVRAKHAPRLEDLGPAPASDFLCELNVIEQAVNVAQTTVLQEAWARGQRAVIHAWIYGIEDGRLRDLDFTVDAAADVGPSYEDALRRLVAAKPARGGEHLWNVTT